MLKLILTAGLLLFSFLLKAQGQPGDSTLYIFGLPVTEEGDSVPKADYGPRDSYIQIPVNKIPEKLLNELREDSLYKGWEKYPVVQQKNTKRFLVRVAEGNSIRIYGFNENGNVVTFDEVTKPDSLQH